MNSEKSDRLEYLFFRYCDGSISKEEMAELDSQMLKSKRARIKYFDSLKTELALSKCLERDIQPDMNSGYLFEELKKMADYEKTAPEVEITKVESQGERIQKFKREKIEYKMSRSSLYSVIASFAAIILVVLFVRYAPSKRTVQVATLIDSIDAQWANKDMSLDIDSGINISDGVRHLLKGCIKVEFLGGAEVIIEGPAEFEFKSFERMSLNSGRLFANITDGTSGFTVDTPSSNIVDLGTQFGVKVDFDGTSDLHMYKGRAVISKETFIGSELASEVVKGQALRVRSSSNKFEEIPFQERMFIRAMSSDSGFIWRGGAVDLMRLTGGSERLSSQKSFIDPVTGKITLRVTNKGQFPNTYTPVNWNPFVDGVFVPNGSSSQVVTSQNDVFTECPKTNGIFCSGIGIFSRDSSLLLDGVVYGNAVHPAVFMRTNLGITYDLEPIWQGVPDAEKLIFRSKIGVSDVKGFGDCDVDFRALVDGEIRYEKRNIRQSGLCDKIELKLERGCRFLTLMTTDNGGLSDESGLKQMDNRWCVFAEPQIDIDTIQTGYGIQSRILIDLGPSNDDGRATINPDMNGNYWNIWWPRPGDAAITFGESFDNEIIDATNNPTHISCEMINHINSNGIFNGAVKSKVSKTQYT